MATKFAEIRIAANAGCRVVLAHGREKDVILRIIAGEQVGTLFLPRRRLSNRKRWILNAQPHGRIEVDPGADQAIKNKRSLLLVGVTGFEGTFRAGDVVAIGDGAKGIARVSAGELRTLLDEMWQLDQPRHPKQRVVVHANDLVTIE